MGLFRKIRLTNLAVAEFSLFIMGLCAEILRMKNFQTPKTPTFILCGLGLKTENCLNDTVRCLVENKICNPSIQSIQSVVVISFLKKIISS